MALIATLLAVGAPGASADESKAKELAKCSADDVFDKKGNCFDLYKKYCVKNGEANNAIKECKRLNGQILLEDPYEQPTVGDKLCKKHRNVACDGVKGIEKGTKKVNDAVMNPADTLASAAFDAVAGKFGNAATEILGSLTSVFLDVSTIKLEDTGLNGGKKLPDGRKSIGAYQMTWALSSVVALFLLIWQFTKVGYSGDGSAAATAIIGLAKWAVICVASLAVTQAALGASDEISTWLMDKYDKGGGDEAFEAKLNTIFMFGGWDNTALILLFGIIAAMASLVLWGEMLLRQAAIVVLVACIPIVAAGGIMDVTKEWWSKTRNALIALILVKPVVVLIFVIGFTSTGNSKSVKDFMVGLLTIVLGALAWPALAKFMTFTSVGSGGGLASGLLGAVGGTAGSMFGYGGGTPSGAGAVGGGRAFTQALQSENDSNAAHAAAGGRVGRFGGLGKLGAAGLALQGAKAGKEMLEGGMEAMAAHADLGPGKDMGGQVNVPPGAGGGGESGDASAPASPPSPPEPGAGGPPPPRAAPLERGSARRAVEAGDNPSAVDGGREPTPISAAPVRPALPPAPRAVDGSEG
ncbi:hypothetical protein [Streptomyces milbemycinicus]|uniref:hypothetical protein n=1 Tax=Streptomyces milbemycinicus TaxID=476552 RepID=UPI0033CABA93